MSLFGIGPDPFQTVANGLFNFFGVHNLGDVIIARRRTPINSPGYPFCGYCYDVDRPFQFRSDCSRCLGTGIIDPPILADGQPDYDADPISFVYELGGINFPVIAFAETNPDREIANFGGFFPGYNKLILKPSYYISSGTGTATNLIIQIGDRAKVWDEWYWVEGIAKFNPQIEILVVAKLSKTRKFTTSSNTGSEV